MAKEEANVKNPMASVEMWDAMAESYAKNPIPTPENNFTIRLIEQHQMCPAGGTALDIGCGAGRHAIALERLGALVTATDFSPKMLEEARRSAREHQAANITFLQENWELVDVGQLGWRGQFDFVLSNLSPAVYNEKSLGKAVSTCRGWFLYTKPCYRVNSVTDRLMELLGRDSQAGLLEGQILSVFTALWNRGLCPQVAYDKQAWTVDRSLKEACSYFRHRLETGGSLTQAQYGEMEDYLEKIAENGRVREETRTTITAIFCDLRKG